VLGGEQRANHQPPLARLGLFVARLQDMKKEYKPLSESTDRELNQPATKRDVKEAVEDLARVTEAGFQKMATKDDLKQFATKTDLKKFKNDIIHEFKAVAENIHKDVAGANKDEISLITEQKLPNHERRIKALEQHAGLPVASR